MIKKFLKKVKLLTSSGKNRFKKFYKKIKKVFVSF